MKRRTTPTSRWLVLPLALAIAAGLSTLARAADHNDPPERSGDAAADIGDFYAWHTTDGDIVAVITVAGGTLPATGQTGTYDADVLYGIHFSNEGSGATPAYAVSHEIWLRMGMDGTGAWGVEATNLPGETEVLSGPVEMSLEGPGGAMVFVGLRDDPFFFDLEGFMNTLATGDLAFMSTRNSLAGANATAIVVRFPASEVTNASGRVHVWATTSRIGS